MSYEWWVLILLAYMLDDNLGERLERMTVEQDANKRFKVWADSCKYLELYDDGKLTKRICHYPSRDNPTNWVICSRALCPYMMLNALPEEERQIDVINVLNSLNTYDDKDNSCYGCEHFELEHDMGTSYPKCKLREKYGPERCDEFKPSWLYSMYLKMEGGAR